MHPDYRDPVRRQALYRLFDQTWPGMTHKLAVAEGHGWPWDPVTTPFARFAGGRALSHVGVLALDVLLDGGRTRIAGVHGVCTDRNHRRQGHYRAVMEQALAWIDARFAIAKLNTGQPHLYEPFGFRVIPQHRFRLAEHGPGGGSATPVRDASWLHEVLPTRDPPSHWFCALDPGWLFGIDEVLWSGDLGNLWWTGEAVVAWRIEGDVLHVHDLVAPTLPTLDRVLSTSPWPFRSVELWMSPDRLAPDAEPVPFPDDEILMVRGPWPLEERPHCVPLHAGH